MSRLFRLTHRERLRSAGWSPGVQGPGIRGRDGGARGRGQRPGRIAEGTGPPSTRPAGLPVTQPGSLVVLGVKANLERDGKAVKVVESASADVPAEGHMAGPLPLRTSGSPRTWASAVGVFIAAPLLPECQHFFFVAPRL